MNKMRLKALRDIYPEGTIVQVEHMEDPHPVPYGTLGKVTHVDDAGQIHVSWDNGSSLALIPGTDKFHIVAYTFKGNDNE